MTLLKKLSLLTGLSLALVATRDASAQWVTPGLSTGDVMELFAHMPACEYCERTWDYSKSPDAPEIAEAIVLTVDGSLLGDRWREAKVMAVYAVLEGQLRRCARGDFHDGVWHSWGTWQLQGIRSDLACRPRVAAQAWWAKARAALAACPASSPEERLAPLASGRCDVAVRLTRNRWEIASRL